jgi:phage replication O-like protein O
MNNPQIENGHLDLANEIVEKLFSYRISGEEYQVLWVILRKTYGWHKKEDRISFSQFAKLTGLKRPTVARAIRKLLSKKIIDVIKNDNSNINTYRFNKHFEQWGVLSKKIMVLSKKIRGVIKNDKRVLSKMIHTKENNTKETITKETVQAIACSEKNQVNFLISLFKEVNPSYERLFANKTERGAIERLVKKNGKEVVERLIHALPRINAEPYAPKITTPYELEMKMGKLKAFFDSQQNKSPKIINLDEV